MPRGKQAQVARSVFGDPVAVAAMVDRLVHHTEVLVLKDESYRLRRKREEVRSGAQEHCWAMQVTTGACLFRFRATLTAREAMCAPELQVLGLIAITPSSALAPWAATAARH